MDAVPQAPVILIAGGGRGVGAATARLAAAQGYDVAISFVSNEPAALAVAADVQAVGRRALPIDKGGELSRLFCNAVQTSCYQLDKCLNRTRSPRCASRC